MTYVFFFQAEDGIRDRNVTGVQTCALPISTRPPGPERPPGSMRASLESRRVGPRPGGARNAGGARPRARRRIRERAPGPRGPSAARRPERHLVLPEEGPYREPE